MRNFFTKKRAVKIILTGYALVILFSFVGQVLAQQIEYTPLAPLPGIGDDGGSFGTQPQLVEYLQSIFRLALGLAAVLAVVMITIGGFEYLSTDVIFKKENGKEKINNALLGLFLAMGAWLFLYTINPKLIELDFEISTPDPVTIATSTPRGGGPQPWSPPSGVQMPEGFPENYPNNAWYKLRFCNVAATGWQGNVTQTFLDSAYETPALAQQECETNPPTIGVRPRGQGSASICLEVAYYCARGTREPEPEPAP